MQEEETMWKVFKLIYCCNELKQIKKDVYVNVKVRYIFQLSHENKFTVGLTDALWASQKM